MTIMDFLLVLLEFIGLSLGILLVVLLFVSIAELVDLISVCYLSKKNKKIITKRVINCDIWYFWLASVR